MDANFSNSSTMTNPHIDWMAMLMHMETPTSPIFNSFEPSSAAAGDYLPVPHEQLSVDSMREMIFRVAAMQPVHIDPESVKPPKRRNVRISKDPQSVAARHRRERISEKIRILQRLVPGGTKMDTASMLDEAIHYVKFLKTQVQCLERGESGGRGRGFGGARAFGPTAASQSLWFFDADNVGMGHGLVD